MTQNCTSRNYRLYDFIKKTETITGVAEKAEDEV